MTHDAKLKVLHECVTQLVDIQWIGCPTDNCWHVHRVLKVDDEHVLTGHHDGLAQFNDRRPIANIKAVRPHQTQPNA